LESPVIAVSVKPGGSVAAKDDPQITQITQNKKQNLRKSA